MGLILWLGYLPFAEQMEELCEHYSEMGIKGFKVDFMDRSCWWSARCPPPGFRWYKSACPTFPT